jgi:hypothetical protein
MGQAWKERRSHPRIAAEIEGHIVCHMGRDITRIRAQNISCSGLYCRVDSYIPPFRQLNITMNLPLRHGKSLRNISVEFDAVVVRTEPQHEVPGRREYNIAIFFSGITEKAKSLVARYIRDHGGQDLTKDEGRRTGDE